MSSSATDSVPYLELTLYFIIIVYLIQTYLNLRQLKCLRKKTVPKVMKKIFRKGVFLLMRSYFLDQWSFSIAYSFVHCGQTLVILHFEMLPLLWNWTQRVINPLKDDSFRSEIYCTIVFTRILALGAFLLNLPWNFCRKLVDKKRIQSDNKTQFELIREIIFPIAFAIVVYPFGAVLVTVVLVWSDTWLPFYLWLSSVAVILFMLIIAHNILAPASNGPLPLSPCALKLRIEHLALSIGLRLEDIHVMMGLYKSGDTHAYVYGLSNAKYLAISYNLISRCNEDEVLAVVAMELGHWRMSHNLWKAVKLALISMFSCTVFGFVRNSNDLKESFGFEERTPLLAPLLLFYFIFSPLLQFVQLGNNLVNRKFQADADIFAVERGFGLHLRTALISLDSFFSCSSNMDKWYSIFHHFELPLVERLENIDKRISTSY